MFNRNEYYESKIKKLIGEDWVRAKARRWLKRLSIDTPRNNLHLKIYSTLEEKNNINTRARDLVVIPSMLNKTIGVHNGRKYLILTIKEKHIGYKLGEFVYPKLQLAKHTSKNKTRQLVK